MKRNLIIIHTTDRGACSWVRFRFMVGLLETNVGGEVVPVISPYEVTEPEVLKRAAAVIVARPTHPIHGDLLERYKAKREEFGFNVFADYDDLLCDIDGERTIPEYNRYSLDPRDIGRMMEKACSGLDGVTVATYYLKKALVRRFGWDNVKVLPNTVPGFAYGTAPRQNVEGDIMKPRVLYAGSTSHFKTGHIGDFEGPWVPWMRKAAEEGTIELHCFGYRVPDFLEGVDVALHPFVPAVAFPQALAAIRPDIYLAPLQDNDFNRCKSDLKLLEAAAIGAALLGSDFMDGPYAHAHPLSLVGADFTEESLGELVRELCRKDSFNAVLAHQRWLMDEGGRYTESNASVLRFLKAYMGDAVGCIS